MPKKGKGKSKNDDWEDEADAIVEANRSEQPAETTRESTRLDGMFADAIQRGKRTDAEYDRATDDLASGSKTEDELIDFYFPNEAQTAEADDEPAGGEGGGDKDKKGKKNRAWRAERDGRNADLVDVSEALEEGDGGVDSEAAATAEVAAVDQMHTELFGASGSPYALTLPAADGPAMRARVFASELQFDEWRRASCDVPKELPLPNMSALTLFGKYGASVHAGGMVRLWDLVSGRRLAASQHKVELTACAARGAVVAVGDAVGAVLLYGTEAEFTPTRLAPAGTGSVRSVAVVALDSTASRVLVVASASDGALTAAVCPSDPWPPAQIQRIEPPIAPLADGMPMHLAAAPDATLFCASAGRVTMHDLRADVATWSTTAGSWGATLAADALGEGVLLDGFAGMSVSGGSSKGTAAKGGAGGAASDTSVAHAPGAVAANGALPSRLVSYCPSWRLLVDATDPSGVVALWDVRQPASSQPAAAVKLAGAGASWVHLDEGEGLSGHLLLSPACGGPVQLYDVRRVACAHNASAARPVATFAPPKGAGVSCFAAQGSTLVVGGGAKCGTALKYSGESADLSKANEEEEDEEEQKGKGKEKKKKRIEKKEVRGSRQSRCA